MLLILDKIFYGKIIIIVLQCKNYLKYVIINVKKNKKENMNVKTLRLKDSLTKMVYVIAKEKNLTESKYIRSLIEKDVAEYRLLKAIESYKNKTVNLSAASEIAGLPYREFLDVLKIKNIPLNLNTIPLEYGISSIKKSLEK